MITEMLGKHRSKKMMRITQSPLVFAFERLEMQDPESIAVKQYAVLGHGRGKTARSITISGWCRQRSI